MENQIVIYQTDNGQTSIDVRLESETVWLTQAQMAELFQKDQSVIARHIANVFKEGELEKNSNMQILHNTLSKYKPTAIYNLDVIISVGYRVKKKWNAMMITAFSPCKSGQLSISNRNFFGMARRLRCWNRCGCAKKSPVRSSRCGTTTKSDFNTKTCRYRQKSLSLQRNLKENLPINGIYLS